MELIRPNLLALEARERDAAPSTLLVRNDAMPPRFAVVDLSVSQIHRLLDACAGDDASDARSGILADLAQCGILGDDPCAPIAPPPRCVKVVSLPCDPNLAPAPPSPFATPTEDTTFYLLDLMSISAGSAGWDRALDNAVSWLGRIEESWVRQTQGGKKDGLVAPRVYLRATFDRRQDRLCDILLRYQMLTLVHVDPPNTASPFKADGLTPQPWAAAVASLAQAGLPVAIELHVGGKTPDSVVTRCRHWTPLNRGAGFILTGAAGDCPPATYAQTLIAVHDANLIPSQRLSPLNAFVESLGGTPAALPYFPAAVEPRTELPQASESCAWRHLCTSWSAPHGDSQQAWQCEVADTLYRRLLADIGRELATDRRAARPVAGERVRALLAGGRIEFITEPIRDEMQIAPEPKSLSPSVASA